MPSAKLIIDGEELAGRDIKFIKDLQKKENNMDTMKNFHFGPCGDRDKISHRGIAVKNLNNEWVSFDKENDEIVNVDLVSFGDGDFVYMLPVALKDIAVGDAIVHNSHVMFVKKVKANSLSAIDVTAGEVKKILPTKSVFGFDFVTKLVSLVDFSSMSASEDNPFGNLLPFLLLNDSKENDVLPLMFLMNNDILTGGSSCCSSSQMALLAMMCQNKDSNMLPLLFLMNQNIK